MFETPKPVLYRYDAREEWNAGKWHGMVNYKGYLWAVVSDPDGRIFTLFMSQGQMILSNP